MASRGPLCGPPCGPKRVVLASIRRSCVFADGALSAFGQREVKSTFTLLYPSVGGWCVVSSIFVFSFQKDLFTFSPFKSGAFPLAFFPAFYILDQFCFSASLGTRSWTSVALLVGHNTIVEWGKRKKTAAKKENKDSVLSCPKTILLAVACRSIASPLSPCISPVSLCFFFLSILALSPNGSGLRVETSASLSLALSGVSSRVHIQSACAGPFQLAASKWSACSPCNLWFLEWTDKRRLGGARKFDDAVLSPCPQQPA